MSKWNQVGLTREEVARLVANPPKLLSSVQAKVFVFEDRVMAELWQGPWSADERSHVVWTHRAHILHEDPTTAPLLSTHYLRSTVDHLAANGWPGIRS